MVHLLDFVGTKWFVRTLTHVSEIAFPVVNLFLSFGPCLLCWRWVIEGFGDTKLGIVP
jgi:hypothetical protein